MIDSTTASMEINLRGRTAVVTGAASGFGAGIAEAMGRAGASLMLVDLNEGGLVETARRVRRCGASCSVLTVDITADDAPARIADRAVENHGSIDVLANVAGVWDPQPFETCSRESLARQMAVNFTAPFLLTQAVVPFMAGGGSIIFIASIAGGLVGFPDSTAYCASKGAVWGLVKALGVELAPRGVRVNAVAPGTVQTNINKLSLENAAHRDWIVDSTPAGRLGEIRDIVGPVLFLASDAASFLNGSTIVADGGFSVI